MEPNYYFCISSHAIPLLPKIPRKMIPSEDSLKTFSWCQIAFNSELPKGTNYAQGTNLNLTIPSLASRSLLVGIGPNLTQTQ